MTYIPQEHIRGRHLVGRWGVAKTGQVAREGIVEQYEWWDGSTDATVRLRPFRIRLKPDFGDDKTTMALIMELERAIRANEAALAAQDTVRHRKTAATVEDIKRRIKERIGDG